MAVFNEILTGTLSNVLAKRLGMQTGTPAPSLAPEIMPTLSLEVDRPEWHYLAGSTLASGFGNVPATVGNLSTVRLNNPANSNVIIVVEQLQSLCTASAEIRLYPARSSPPTLLAQQASSPSDTRILQKSTAPTRNTVGLLSQDAIAAASPGGFVAGRLFAAISNPLRVSFILAPGSALDIQCATANTALQCAVWWRERAAVSGELL